MPIAKGTLIGPYEVVGWLGAGGMGEVYRARDARLSRDVAIKLIPETIATDANRLRRFEQEARAAGQLNHPNILSVFDIGVHAGAPYIVSELLEGESLRSVLHRGPIPPRKAVDYARQTAEGLAAAHDKRIVHRDVKPDNLFVTEDGRLKILDFGIAKLTRPSDDEARHTGFPTETDAGTVIGTAGYMSPEQVRGEVVDARSDLFSVGTVLYEMLTGRPAFGRETTAETMTAILKEDPPPVAGDIPPALARIVARCLEKTRETRFQSARDLAFGLEVLSETHASTVTAAVPTAASGRWRVAAIAAAVITLGAFMAVVGWLTWRAAPTRSDNPLASATFTRVTDWDGTEEDGAISSDGRFVAFLSDRAGQFDLWLTQLSTGDFRNLTTDVDPLENSVTHVFRKFGFSDGAEIWFGLGSGPSMAQMLMPLLGGTPRPFLGKNATAPMWSPDGRSLAYFNNVDGDPMFVADPTGANARQILAPQPGMHSHNPVWSPDSQWIYFVRGEEPTDQMNVWRIRPSGESLEPLTEQTLAANFLAPLDSRLLLYVARADDGSGPWLWSLDVLSKVTRQIRSGLEQYLSVTASRDGQRIIATIANPTSSLWSVPIRDRLSEDRDVKAFPLPTARGLGPRFRGPSLFYLSARAGADGLWRVQDGQAFEVSRGADAPLSEPPAVSPDGSRAVVVVRHQGKRRLAIVSADGRSSRRLDTSFDIQGAVGQGTVDWSPDGASIVVGGKDAEGPGLFTIAVDSGVSRRLIAGDADNPVWSPDGKLIVYSGPFFTGQVPLLGVRPDGTPVALPGVRARPGGYRFLPDGSGLVFLPRLQSLDFWLFDLATGATRQLTRLSNQGRLTTFDVTPDGTQVVFDRTRDNADIVLIDVAK